MGILTRIVRIWKSDVNGVMDELEDKELLLKQHLREMEEELHRKEALLGSLLSKHRGLQAERKSGELEQERLEQDLKIAVTKGKDEISRMLIKKIHLTKRAVKEISGRMELLEQEMETIESVVKQQRADFQELSQKAAAYLLNREREERNLEGFSSLSSPDHPSLHELSEEEIELELLKYKEEYEKPEQGGVS